MHEWTLTLWDKYPKDGFERMEIATPVQCQFYISGITVDLEPGTNIKDYRAIIFGGKIIKDKDGDIYPNAPSFEFLINSAIFMSLPMMNIPNSKDRKFRRNPLCLHQNFSFSIKPGCTVTYRIQYPCRVPTPSKTDNVIIIKLKGEIGG